jgi:uncharacterized protein (TIGR03437 family)
MKRFSLRLFLILACVSIAATINPVNAQTTSSSVLQLGITFNVGTASKVDPQILIDPVKGFSDSLTAGPYSASVSVSLLAPNHWRIVQTSNGGSSTEVQPASSAITWSVPANTQLGATVVSAVSATTGFDSDFTQTLGTQSNCVTIQPGIMTGPGGQCQFVNTSSFNTIWRLQGSGIGVGGTLSVLCDSSTCTDSMTTDIEAGVPIHSIEVTQAIQQWQTLTELNDCLHSGLPTSPFPGQVTCQAGQPPVPIVANKPAVLRVYMNQVSMDTTYTVDVSGDVSGNKTQSLEPECTPLSQRQGQIGCQSFDFPFPNPPVGQWTVTVNVSDSNGNQLEALEPLTFTSVTAPPLTLVGVSVCDRPNSPPLVDQCGDATQLLNDIGLLAQLAPTGTVSVSVLQGAQEIVDCTTYGSQGAWWSAVDHQIYSDYGVFSAEVPDVIYVGVTRPTLFCEMPPYNPSWTGGGNTGGRTLAIPSNVTAVRTSVMRMGAQAVGAVVAHEIGHAVSLSHTDTNVPYVPLGSPPGCYGLAALNPAYPALGIPAQTKEYPFNDNYIRSFGPFPADPSSPDAFEVGFNLTATGATVDPITPPLGPVLSGPQVNGPAGNAFDLMGYCLPRWITPFSYVQALNYLTEGMSSGAPPATGTFWKVSGTILSTTTGSTSTEEVAFDPLFQAALSGSSAAGSGSYQIEVRGPSGSALFTRNFNPAIPQTETDDIQVQYIPSFSELVPVAPGAASIVVLGPNNQQIGALVLAGTPPTVTVVSPVGGATLSGTQNITWTIADPDSTAFTTRVFYANNGGSWTQLVETPSTPGTNTFAVDFDTFPAGSAQIMLWVSDGINTGQATSSAFTVPKKNNVTAQILSPSPNEIFRSGALVSLQVNAFAVDGGVLNGSSVQWTSNLNGALGAGANLAVTTLQPGQHQITVTATDSDGNVGSQVVPIVVAGSGPTINLSVAGSQAAPATCAQASIQATAGSVPLSQVAYSLDSGKTWTGLPIATTPLTFTLSGSGAFYVIAHAIDVAGQLASKDSQFSTTGACQSQQSLPPLANVNAASFSSGPLAAQSLVTVFGSGLATGTAPATSVPLPTSLDGTTVTVTDSFGNIGLASLFYVSPGQINYQIPAGLGTGASSLAIANSNGSVSIGTLQLVPVAPGLFSANANGKGVAAAIALLVAANGTQTPVPVFQCSTSGGCVSVPIDLGSPTDQLVLEFFGTGIRRVSALANATCTLGSAAAQVLYAGAQGQYVGLDQVNVIIPRSLAGSGEVPVSLVVDGQAANAVTVNIK